MTKTRARSALVTMGCAALVLYGCAPLLGIEEIKASKSDAGSSEDKDASGGASGSHAKMDAGGAGKGGSAPDGSTGGAGSGGSDAGKPKDAGTGMDAGKHPDSGASDAGKMDAGGGSDSGHDAGHDGGTDAGQDSGNPGSTVSGKVIDYNMNPAPNAVIAIGSATTTTNSNGEFSIDGVPDQYDIGVTITVPRYGSTEVAGWLFVGLTRRDPTLQVYRGLPLRSGNYLTITTNNVSFPLATGEQVDLTWGSPYSGFTYSMISQMMFQTSSTSWEGPTTVDGMAHALRWTNASSSPNLPMTYTAFNEQALSLTDGADATLALSLGMPSTPLQTGMVSGNVSTVATGDRYNAVFVRFSDNSTIQLVDQSSAPNSFSYLVPSLPNASIVVAATVTTPGYAYAYSDDVTPGTSGIQLTLPSAPTITGPSNGASNVDGTTSFTWAGPDQVYMLHAESDDYYEDFYVVTAAKQAYLPVPPLTNLPLEATKMYTYEVQVHDSYATVDDATGPNGFLDDYCRGDLEGTRHGHGSHAESDSKKFTAK